MTRIASLRRPAAATTRVFFPLFPLALALGACAGTEEPPQPPPPPVDPAVLNSPQRPPAPNVDVSADLDAAVVWADAGSSSSSSGGSAKDAGVGARR
jgi:hypothetical protein